MTKLQAILRFGLCVLVGMLMSPFWLSESAHAQVSRFGLQCVLGMDGAGIIEVPCDRRDHSAR
jgi:hypothetical protein